MQNAGNLLAVLLTVTALLASTASAANRLEGHPSPYLALHANDPVDWQDWKPEVFEQAREHNRLVLVSVGYFSCHWCHVMQRQSYQDVEVAELLNRSFIAVKVDRELEPDLDRRLIDFVKQVRGAAGWPLNVFLTPDGYPLTGFTYLPRDNFFRLLGQLEAEWKRKHDNLGAVARQFFETSTQESGDQDVAYKMAADVMVDAYVAQTMRSADELQGGIGNSSKFPNVPQLEALLDSLEFSSHNPDVAEFILLSLQAMTTRNLSDHVNGGFFRYTTDPDWLTPHFEKMLYDNALLASLLLKAHKIWPDQGYAATALATLDFIEAQLKHSEGGYMSSLSAVDKADREGGAYLWDEDQLDILLDAAQLQRLRESWHFDPVADRYLLRPPVEPKDPQLLALDHSILASLRSRDDATMPADDKRLASWNAMMLEALTRAAAHDERFAKRAQTLFQNMRALFLVDGGLIRFAGNAAVADAEFEDYAYSAQAFQYYGQHFDDQIAIDLARQLTEQAHVRFLREGRWQATANPLIPIARGRWIIGDLVIPSAMTRWLQAALTLPGIDSEIHGNAQQMLRRQTREMIDRPYYYGSLIMLRAKRDAQAATGDSTAAAPMEGSDFHFAGAL